MPQAAIGKRYKANSMCRPTRHDGQREHRHPHSRQNLDANVAQLAQLLGQQEEGDGDREQKAREAAADGDKGKGVHPKDADGCGKRAAEQCPGYRRQDGLGPAHRDPRERQDERHRHLVRPTRRVRHGTHVARRRTAPRTWYTSPAPAPRAMKCSQFASGPSSTLAKGAANTNKLTSRHTNGNITTMNSWWVKGGLNSAKCCTQGRTAVTCQSPAQRSDSAATATAQRQRPVNLGHTHRHACLGP